MRPKTLEADEKLTLYHEVAYLAGGGMKQLDIAKRMGVSEATVSKRLKKAAELGLVHYLPTLPAKELEEIRLRVSATEKLENRVRARLLNVPHVCVCPRPFHGFAALHLSLVLEEALSDGHLQTGASPGARRFSKRSSG